MLLRERHLKIMLHRERHIYNSVFTGKDTFINHASQGKKHYHSVFTGKDTFINHASQTKTRLQIMLLRERQN